MLSSTKRIPSSQIYYLSQFVYCIYMCPIYIYSFVNWLYLPYLYFFSFSWLMITQHCKLFTNFKCIYLDFFFNVKVLVVEPCPILCDPMDYSPSGFSVHGILQARILEWVALPFSWGSSQSWGWTWVSGIAGRYFIIWATRKALFSLTNIYNFIKYLVIK